MEDQNISVNFYLNEDIFKKFKKKSIDDSKSMSNILRELVNFYLNDGLVKIEKMKKEREKEIEGALCELNK